MEVAIKKLTAFRLDSNLLDMLKSAAKREHRSLNNFVECLLWMPCTQNQTKKPKRP